MVIVNGLNGTIKDAIEELQALSATGGGGGATTFLGLTDTPGSYSGHGGKYVMVSGLENALVFSDPAMNLDGGVADSVYLITQLSDGGGA